MTETTIDTALTDTSASPAEEARDKPIENKNLLGAGHFIGAFSGEHVAGTEFVFGVTFVMWGARAFDVVAGLLLGNMIAVLCWALLCAPVATKTRLSLYAFLEKVAGSKFCALFNLINGLTFLLVGAAMVTVSTSAMRVLFGMKFNAAWYPETFGFAFLACCIGAIVVLLAVAGFRRLSQFASICAPWITLCFAMGGMLAFPYLAYVTLGQDSVSLSQIPHIAKEFVWTGVTPDGRPSITLWEIAAFAWCCNIPHHLAMGDMSTLRFARKSWYGFFSAFGMFIGHTLAWCMAGLMGALAATALKENIVAIDSGDVAYQSLGLIGILAVLLAGWTTSNPSFYRAGVAFQALTNSPSRTKTTIVAGGIGMVIGCFPFVFQYWMPITNYVNLLSLPIGAILVGEFFILPKLGVARCWNEIKGQSLNKPAAITWGLTVVLAYAAVLGGYIDLFFAFIPAFVFALVLYVVLVKMEAGNITADKETLYIAPPFKESDLDESEQEAKQTPFDIKVAKWITILSLVVLAIMCINTFNFHGNFLTKLESFKSMAIIPTIIYFASAFYYVTKSNKGEEE
ncbi:purine-cytosine permease family protein [Vibrio salinus]|uniref:purine-cytosine permease family protein n=1 Tax=Vibrio salinus TaxID=2899784 RepID=UPI001E6502B1|nr:nucleoside transporter [Vibrio salinus]MCE0492494.1 nucleoside transporter [Vibrio salinus]